MGFFDLFAQNPAPIETRMTAGVPQAPQVQQAPGGMPAQQPMQPPQPMQPQTAQPGSTNPPAQPGNPELVGKWTDFMNRITQPDVLGPLQTFLAAAAAPMQPGESMGARLAYASTLMQLHKSMLDENARLAPQLAEERELKMQQMRGQIEQTAAATEASRRAGQRAQQQMDYDEETKLQRIDLLDQQINAAKAQGNAAEAQRLEAERKRLHLEKWGDKTAAAEIRAKNSQAGMLDRSPKEGGAGGSAKNPKFSKLSDEGFRQTYENSVRKPFFAWSAAQKAQGKPDDWFSFIAQSHNVTQINEMQDEASARGMPMEWLTAGGSMPRQGAAPQGALGTPQNPITRPRPGGQPAQQPSAFPPGLPDRIPR